MTYTENMRGSFSPIMGGKSIFFELICFKIFSTEYIMFLGTNYGI